MRVFKKYFDAGYLSDQEAPEKEALQEAVNFLRSKHIEVKNPLQKEAKLERFVQVVPGLYRGSAPALKDVVILKDDYGIKKIVSLDQQCGSYIKPICQSLGINQVMIPIDGSKESLKNFMMYDIKHLLLDDGPVYVHCRHGKDRTGFAVALLRMKQGMSFEQAYQEALSFGFGKWVDPAFMKNLTDIMKMTKPSPGPIDGAQDENLASDIVDASREHSGDPRDSVIEGDQPGSFTPYQSQMRTDQYDPVYKQVNDQSPTRENYESYKHPKGFKGKAVPMPNVGITSMDNGKGLGSPETIGGFIYE